MPVGWVVIMKGQLWVFMPGVAPSPPAFVSLTVSSRSESWRYLKCHDLSLLADGVAVKGTVPTHNGDVGRGGVYESVNVVIPLARFQRLARARSVEGKLCNVEFSLTALNIARLNAFTEPMRVSREVLAQQAGLREKWADSLSVMRMNGRFPVVGWRSKRITYSSLCSLWRSIPVAEIILFVNEDAVNAAGFRASEVRCD